MEIVITLGGIASALIAITTFCTLIFKPLRKKVVNLITDVSDKEEINQQLQLILNNINEQKEVGDCQVKALKSLLSSSITAIYYKNLNTKTLREYEAKTLDRNYDAYKGLHANSYIERIYNEMLNWKVIP